MQNNNESQEIGTSAKALQAASNYTGLLKMYDAIIAESQDINIAIDTLPKRAYCLARLNKSQKANEVLHQYTDLCNAHNRKLYFHLMTAISLFIENGECFKDPIQREVLSALLNNKSQSSIIKNVIFDWQRLT